MATKIAIYKFNDYDDWTAAQNRLYEALGGSNYSNAITNEGSNPYWITIWDNCDDSRTAGQICKETAEKFIPVNAKTAADA